MTIANNPPASTLANSRRTAPTIIFVIVVLLSTANFYLAFVGISRFAAIFVDMLGDGPLPRLTALVLTYRLGLVVLACGWLLCALIVFRRTRSVRILSALLTGIAMQISITIFALFLPLSPIIQSVQDSQ